MLTAAQKDLLDMQILRQVTAPTFAATMDEDELYALVTTMDSDLATEYTKDDVMATARAIIEQSNGQLATNGQLVMEVAKVLRYATKAKSVGVTPGFDPKGNAPRAVGVIGKFIGNKTPQQK